MICSNPKCGSDRIHGGTVNGRYGYVCVDCGEDYIEHPIMSSAFIPHNPSLVQRVAEQDEARVVTAIQKAIEAAGGIYLRCGQRNARGAGNTVGAPDLFLRLRTWVPHVWLGVEVKGTGGRARPAQAALAEIGAIVIVDTVEDAMDAVDAADTLLRGHNAFNRG